MPVKPQRVVPNGMDEYWAIVRRRFWWIALPLFLGWSVVWTIGWFIPAFYMSEAVILVEQQKVPENYVASNVTVDLQDRLQSMTQQILSRTRLQTTIDRFHLYQAHPSLRMVTLPDDPVEQMRKDIKIDLVRSAGHEGELTAFKIQYIAGSPDLAQQVNNELTSLFIDENLKAQEQQSENTTAFLKSELDDARASLEEQEATVRAFKAAHFGNLPSELQSNVQILAGLQGEMQGTQKDIDSANQQKLYLESLLEQLGQYGARQASQPGLDGGQAVATPLQALDQQLQAVREQLVNARLKYTDDYPDVIVLRDKVAATEKLKKQMENAAEKGENAIVKSVSAEEKDTVHAAPTASTIQIQSQLKAIQLEIEDYQRHLREIGSRIAEYQSRLNLTPETEQQLADVSRGYEESMANYNSLLQKQMQSQLATSLEQRQQGEQFRILDPPSLPVKPESPNHLKVSLSGLMVGAAVGLALAFLLEATRPRIWQAGSLEEVVPARLLVALPHLSTPDEEGLEKLSHYLKIGAVAAMAALILAGNLYAFLKG